MKTDSGDKSVPITWAYNHHFEAYISGSYSQMTQLESTSNGAFPFGQHNYGAPTYWLALPNEELEDPRPTSRIPISQWFSEGNGGEFRLALIQIEIFSPKYFDFSIAPLFPQKVSPWLSSWNGSVG